MKFDVGDAIFHLPTNRLGYVEGWIENQSEIQFSVRLNDVLSGADVWLNCPTEDLIMFIKHREK